MSGFPAHWHGSEKIAFLIYPKFTALDMVGPHYMLGSLMGATTYIVAKTMDPVVSDMKLAIMPTHTFETCPQGHRRDLPARWDRRHPCSNDGCSAHRFREGISAGARST